jgi:hypothetical protein
VLLQDPNDLLFRISLALHRLVLSKGQTPIHSGSIQGGNVTRTGGRLPGIEGRTAVRSTPSKKGVSDIAPLLKNSPAGFLEARLLEQETV